MARRRKNDGQRGDRQSLRTAFLNPHLTRGFSTRGTVEKRFSVATIREKCMLSLPVAVRYTTCGYLKNRYELPTDWDQTRTVDGVRDSKNSFCFTFSSSVWRTTSRRLLCTICSTFFRFFGTDSTACGKTPAIYLFFANTDGPKP